jgi:hypothetical protein
MCLHCFTGLMVRCFFTGHNYPFKLKIPRLLSRFLATEHIGIRQFEVDWQGLELSSNFVPFWKQMQ